MYVITGVVGEKVKITLISRSERVWPETSTL